MTAAVAEMAERIRALPRALLYGATPECAEAVHAVLKRTIKAGQSPEGVPWEPRKKGTAPVLVDAADAVRVGAVGRKIVMRVMGVEGKHHRGIVKGGTARRIILHEGITPPVAAAIRRVLDKVFHEVTGG
jgi:hypothetical protein